MGTNHTPADVEAVIASYGPLPYLKKKKLKELDGQYAEEFPNVPSNIKSQVNNAKSKEDLEVII